MSKNAFREYSPGEVLRNGESAYTVGERIARGKFGASFTGQDDWGNPLILQVLWPFSRSYENVREPWCQQVAELKRAWHPGLVGLLDGFEAGGCFHLVYERCDHRLDHSLASPGWDGRPWLLAVARPVLSALGHCHRHGYIHRNLHPHNVFCAVPLQQIRPDTVFSGAIKLGDLGANTLLGKVDVLNAKIPRWLVPPEYLSPSECGPMDHRVDIYQAGLLFLAVLLGRIPLYSFEEISLGQPARDAEQLDSSYGPVLARALRLKVAERFGSALELWQALSGSAPAL